MSPCKYSPSWPNLAQIVLTWLQLPDGVREYVAPLQVALDKLATAEDGDDRAALSVAQEDVKKQAQILKDWIEE